MQDVLQQQRNLSAIIEYLQKIGVQLGFSAHSSNDSLKSAVSNGDSKKVLMKGGPRREVLGSIRHKVIR